MRAREFISEQQAHITKRQQSATKGLHIYGDSERWNGDYVMNRIMMAAACTDGKIKPPVDQNSWVGKYKTSHPYTKEENDMLKIAYEAAGADYIDVNNGDLDSEEVPDTNKTSPVTGFKGYSKR